MLIGTHRMSLSDLAIYRQTRAVPSKKGKNDASVQPTE
jgi:hypothetical protein